MSDSKMPEIDALLERAQGDADLRERLLADPRGTIKAETGMNVPDDWAIVATDNAGTVELAFANGELPEAYLEMVSGGSTYHHGSCSDEND